MNRSSHTHLCTKCDQRRPCDAATNGGCIFPSTSDVTCNRCANLSTDTPRQLRAMLKAFDRLTGKVAVAERVAIARELRRRGEPLTDPTEEPECTR